jgi:hypothetical protein
MGRRSLPTLIIGTPSNLFYSLTSILMSPFNSISAVPAFPGLRRFPDGRDFSQWTGDDSKALMKVFLYSMVHGLD